MLVQTQTNNPNTNIQFYPRIVNKTNISFTDDEVTFLNKSLKYNLSQKRKSWLRNLAVEAEADITLLPSYEQEDIRYQVSHNLQELYKQHNDRHAVFDKTIMSENKTIIQINKKLIEANPWSQNPTKETL